MSLEYRTSLDPITLSVIGNKIGYITKEMGITTMKTSRNPLYNVAHDFSCFITDAHGQVLSCVEGVPIHVGGGGMTARKVLEYYQGDIHPGDSFLVNDIYLGAGNHLLDWLIATPVFVDDEFCFMACIRAHQIDIGGGVAGGYNPYATEIFQEGLRIPPIRIVERGQVRQDVVNLVKANSRVPETISYDLLAMAGVTRVASKRLQEFAAPYGVTTIKDYLNALLDYAEARMRAELRKIPNGIYYGEEYLEVDEDRFAKIPVKITINDDNVIVDFTGAESQLPSSTNSSLTNTVAAVFQAVCSIIDPSIPHNEGVLRPLQIIAPPGTVVNASYPAATGMCTGHPALEISYACFRALAQAVPEEVIAGSMKMIWPVTSFTDPVTKEMKILYHYHAMGGVGAVSVRDGLGALAAAWGGGPFFPDAEQYEVEFPIEIMKLEWRQDGGGAGEFRGGCGIEYEVKLLKPGVTMFRTKGLKTRPYGVNGGKPGKTTFVSINKGTKKERVPKGFCVEPIDEGEILSVSCSGGGGWGDPFKRDPEKVRGDVLNGYISVGSALEYGVVLNEETLEVDIARTNEVRSEYDVKT